MSLDKVRYMSRLKGLLPKPGKLKVTLQDDVTLPGFLSKLIP